MSYFKQQLIGFWSWFTYLQVSQLKCRMCTLRCSGFSKVRDSRDQVKRRRPRPEDDAPRRWRTPPTQRGQSFDRWRLETENELMSSLGGAGQDSQAYACVEPSAYT